LRRCWSDYCLLSFSDRETATTRRLRSFSRMVAKALCCCSIAIMWTRRNILGVRFLFETMMTTTSFKGPGSCETRHAQRPEVVSRAFHGGSCWPSCRHHCYYRHHRPHYFLHSPNRHNDPPPPLQQLLGNKPKTPRNVVDERAKLAWIVHEGVPVCVKIVARYHLSKKAFFVRVGVSVHVSSGE
jgi:hypothetical protein